MKILHVGNLKSGIDTYVRNVIEMTCDDFNFVVVGGADDNNNQPYMRKGKKVKYYSIDLYRSLNPFKDIKALYQIICIIRKEKPDLIHCHSAKGGVVGRVGAFLTGTKSVYTPHAFSFLSSDKRFKQHIFLLFEKVTRLSSVLLGCSESERTLGIKRVGYLENKAFVWNNAIPPIDNELIEKPNCLNNHRKYIISIGRPSFQKNPLFLVEVMKRVHQSLPELKCYLLGVGYYSPMLEKVESLILEYNLSDTIILIPWVSRAEALGYLESAQLYLTTSLYEGLPIAVLEAMALGKAIIASDVIGNQDCVKSGYNGFLLSFEADLFAEKVVQLMHDDYERMKMGVYSKELFEEKFLINSRIGELEEIYKKIPNI